MNKLANLAGACGIILTTMSAQAIPVYTTAEFSGGILTVTSLGSTLGLQRTSTCSGCAAGSVGGNVLFDKSLIPGNGTGVVNIPLASVAGASNDVIFDIIFGSQPLEFQFGDADIIGGPSIQFKNGVFNGFFFVEDFSYNGTPFELSMQGGGWTISAWNNHSYSDLAASGYLTAGKNGLTNQALFDPVQQPAEVVTVPEPTTVALIVLGVWGLIMARRRERLRSQMEADDRSRVKEDLDLPRPPAISEKEASVKGELHAS